MRLTINGTCYDLDLTQSVVDGKVRVTEVIKYRQVKPTDIPNGAIFKFLYKGDETLYIMRNNTWQSNGQCMEVNNTHPLRSWFGESDELVLHYWNEQEYRWVKEIRM